MLSIVREMDVMYLLVEGFEKSTDVKKKKKKKRHTSCQRISFQHVLAKMTKNPSFIPQVECGIYPHLIKL